MSTTLDSSAPVALVTGAGARRIGNCVARELARAGYRLAMHARTSIVEAHATARELTDQGCDVLVVQGDLSDENAVRDLTAAAQSRFGRIDALVNCAAIWERKSLEEVSAEDVRRHLDANLLGTFLCCREVGLRMVEQSHGGAIVNLGDWATVRPYRDYAAYFPSKGGIETLTRTFAMELGTRNPRVRVNAILPGPVMLPADLPEAERSASIAGTLVKREGTPEHVADAVLFLLRNDYITGISLPVDGGRSVFAGGG